MSESKPTTCHHCDEPAIGIATGQMHGHRLPKAGINVCANHAAFASKVTK